MKNDESLGAVYIVGFNKINLCKHRNKKLCILSKAKFA